MTSRYRGSLKDRGFIVRGGGGSTHRGGIPGISANSALSAIRPPLAAEASAVELVVVVVRRRVEPVPGEKFQIMRNSLIEWFLEARFLAEFNK